MTTIFVDASALVAVIAGEPERATFAAAIARANDPICSAVTLWESVAGLCHVHRFSMDDARREVRDTVAARPIRMVPIGEQEAELAIEAYAVFGKGRHPAGLNMGDCFAYACAKANDAKLLYKGNDFSRTDLA